MTICRAARGWCSLVNNVYDISPNLWLRPPTARAKRVFFLAAEVLSRGASCGRYDKAPFLVSLGGGTIFYSLSGPEIAPADGDFGTPEQRENIPNAKWQLLARTYRQSHIRATSGMAPASDIPSKNVRFTPETPRKISEGYRGTIDPQRTLSLGNPSPNHHDQLGLLAI